VIPAEGRHARRRPKGRIAIGAGVVAVLLIGAIMVYAGIGTPGRGDWQSGEIAQIKPTRPAPSLEQPPRLDQWPRWGVTHTQFSADNMSDETKQLAEGLLGRVPMLQNQHIMGWGADNPEPSPGRYDFDSLDSRLMFMSASRATPVITLCCAPDWMKGGQAGRTDWTKNDTVAPKREHYADYAKLAVRVAKQYPTVTHFMVWNEFKGFWNDAGHRWNAEGYTEMYNMVYDALKKLNPEIQVGGPYMPVETDSARSDSELAGPWGTVDQRALDGIEYWLQHKKGADFVVVDGASPTDAHELLPDAFGALGKFSAVTTWLREKTGDLPIWWSEFYFEPEDGTDWPEPMRLAVQAAAMMEFAKSGAATALYWNPQTKDGACAACMWDPRTGALLPTGRLTGAFAKWFPAGAELEPVTSSDPKVRVLAQPQKMVMVNTTGGQVTTTVDGTDFTLKPYEIKWSDR
jgi:hypothetical protein